MRRRKNGMSSADRVDLWRRWKEGQSLSEIGRALGKAPGSVHGVLSASGGIAPSPRRRSPRSLSLAEREEISRGVSAGASIRAIAVQLGRAPSTVSREVARNGGASKYRATTADDRAWKLGRRPKPCKLAVNRRLQQLVASRLRANWSPEQISGWLKVQFPRDERMRVSHETIYRSLFIQARGVLRKELQEHLRTRRVMRRSKLANTAGQQRGQIVDAVSIRERPAEFEDRAVPGHWEGDLLSGAGNSHIATLVERRSRFTMLVKVAGKDSTNVVSAMITQVQKLPVELRRSLTWDRGMEMAQHKAFSVATNVSVYFCDPKSPWQRGTNENTNRLLRQYFPDGTDLSEFSQKSLNEVADALNRRPRKTLAFRAPADTFYESLR
jgi:IS30 family transposase